MTKQHGHLELMVWRDEQDLGPIRYSNRRGGGVATVLTRLSRRTVTVLNGCATARALLSPRAMPPLRGVGARYRADGPERLPVASCTTRTTRDAFQPPSQSWSRSRENSASPRPWGLALFWCPIAWRSRQCRRAARRGRTKAGGTNGCGDLQSPVQSVSSSATAGPTTNEIARLALKFRLADRPL